MERCLLWPQLQALGLATLESLNAGTGDLETLVGANDLRSVMDALSVQVDVPDPVQLETAEQEIEVVGPSDRRRSKRRRI